MTRSCTIYVTPAALAQCRAYAALMGLNSADEAGEALITLGANHEPKLGEARKIVERHRSQQDEEIALLRERPEN